MPRWGVWVDGRFWYDGAPTTVHVRNLARNPACTLHLEDGWQAAIVDGTSICRPILPASTSAPAAARAYAAKYRDRGYEPKTRRMGGARCRRSGAVHPHHGRRVVRLPDRCHPLSIPLLTPGRRAKVCHAVRLADA